MIFVVILLAACAESGRSTTQDLGHTQDMAQPVDMSAAVDMAVNVDFAQPPLPDVHVVITADNAYAFGWGDVNQVTNLKGFKRATLAGEIFNCPVGNGPEAYDVPGAEAPNTAYLYIIAWCDFSTYQGVIGEFIRGGDAIYTGSADWEACATGIAYESASSGAPTESIINQQITVCNAGSGSTTTTSAGWVNTVGATAVTPGAVGTLVAGVDNSAARTPFPIVCQQNQVDGGVERGVDPAAQWMWYSPNGLDPFRASNGTNNWTRSFIIFRLPANVIPIPIS